MYILLQSSQFYLFCLPDGLELEIWEYQETRKYKESRFAVLVNEGKGDRQSGNTEAAPKYIIWWLGYLTSHLQIL